MVEIGRRKTIVEGAAQASEHGVEHGAGVLGVGRQEAAIGVPVHRLQPHLGLVDMGMAVPPPLRAPPVLPAQRAADMGRKWQLTHSSTLS